jgi:hypothetical protein
MGDLSADWGKTRIMAHVNRTQVTGVLSVSRDKRDIDVFGCGLHHTIAMAPKDARLEIIINVTTPFMPITSDGQAPDLTPFTAGIRDATGKAVRRARCKTRPDKKVSQKDVVLTNLAEAIAAVSGDGAFRFNERQLFYALRPLVLGETNKELMISHFKAIITDHEGEHGEITGMYREARGSLYHPHSDGAIALGTLMVEEYERPAWTFNKLLYIEKEGFSEALKEVKWPERHDCRDVVQGLRDPRRQRSRRQAR